MKACELCGRVTKTGTTEHHLIPRTCHSNKWFKKNYSREQMAKTVDLCRPCHNEVHRLIPSEKDLGRHFNSLDLLKSNPEIAKFVAWVQKQK